MRGSLQRLWRAPLIAIWLLLGLLLSIWIACLRRLAPRQLETQRRWLGRRWMAGLIQLLPLRIHRHGVIPKQTALWVSNHVSWLDIVVLGAQKPVRFLSKSEVGEWPLIGRLTRAAGTLFIERGQTAEKVLGQLAQSLADGDSLVVFAEGTTTAGDRVRTFHGRLLGSAQAAGCPVQPVALSYRVDGKASREAAFIHDDEFSSHLLNLLKVPSIDVDIHFLPTLDSSMSRNQLARAAQSAVSQALGLKDETPTTSPVASRAA